MSSDVPLVLLTGGTGYIGGRLLPLLGDNAAFACGASVASRNELRSRVAATTEVVQGDVLDLDSLRAALSGVHTAYYLVHSLGTKRDFEREDRQAAANFATAARQAGVQRIIYLGGLGDAEHGLSPHLRSRQETGEVLRSSGVPVIELRASIIIGSGSLSFELIRALTERLPGDDLPPLGRHAHAAHRHRRRAGVSAGRPRLARRDRAASSRSAGRTPSPTATSCGSTPGNVDCGD